MSPAWARRAGTPVFSLLPRLKNLKLQVRTRVLNGELEQTFRLWYPKFRPEVAAALKAAA